ncbi:hypothetical protein LZF95_23825 [Algoriphagus sp. AGSA1]|uniref:hypothetical protein n=1 Tax=Algoriphagus sp. AGSA1 TaxID=2907213 RepID=UPI001F45B470|nr:hypothetical protein [Algoriphagus sp. AGSA1]MCE7057733.1 hypothetical protein [Algoriphagus sp. AGSA1]
MKNYFLALDKDINKQYNDAVFYYQKSIDEKELNIEAYLNLSFLYWNFQDFGFFTYYNISEELREIGCLKYTEIIEEGIQQYPNNLELNFWKRYFQHIIYGEEFSAQDCMKLIEEYGDTNSKVPYFFLYLFDKGRYKEEKVKLIEECNKEPTAKNLYIKSVLG